MDFYSVRELGIESKDAWSSVLTGNEIVVTDEGKPAALMIDIPSGAFDETVQAVRQAKAMIAMNSMRRRAERAGFMNDDEINGIISEVRREH